MLGTKTGNNKHYRGSSLLLSAGQRIRRVILAVLLLWLLTAWALEWI